MLLTDYVVVAYPDPPSTITMLGLLTRATIVNFSPSFSGLS